VVDSQTPHICCLIGCFLIHSLPEEILWVTLLVFVVWSCSCWNQTK
jgi:hypothetical protein